MSIWCRWNSHGTRTTASVLLIRYVTNANYATMEPTKIGSKTIRNQTRIITRPTNTATMANGQTDGENLMEHENLTNKEWSCRNCKRPFLLNESQFSLYSLYKENTPNSAFPFYCYRCSKRSDGSLAPPHYWLNKHVSGGIEDTYYSHKTQRNPNV